MDFITILQIFDSTLRLATPLLLACLAGLFSERSGIFDIGLEGTMLIAAFFSAAVAALTGNVWLGLLAGVSGSMVLALLHGLASITFRGDQLISGVAINFLAAGLTVIIAQDWFAQGGRTPGLSGAARFNAIKWPFADAARDIPIFGPFYQELVSGHTFLVYIALLAVPTAWYVLFRTRFGLRLRAVGENPAAVDTAGISVVRLRYSAVLICGFLCGLAGVYLATGLSAGFVKEMSAGRGFIALAALIFAKWRPWQALGACLLFGLLEALGNRYQNIDVATLLIVSIVVAIGVLMAIRSQDKPGIYLGGGIAGIGVLLWLSRGIIGLGDSFTVPVQFMQALPYILTVVILAGFVGKAIPPRAGGAPYVKES
jgi:simple sugar transport system permease protein